MRKKGVLEKTKIPKRWLLLLLFVLWGIAGFNVLNIGVPTFISSVDSQNIGSFMLCLSISIVIFALFQLMFYRVIKKHRKRIMSYEGKVYFIKMMDIKGYVLIAFMIAIGVTLRAIEAIPRIFIGVFYIGLGSALAFSALIFITFFIKESV